MKKWETPEVNVLGLSKTKASRTPEECFWDGKFWCLECKIPFDTWDQLMAHAFGCDKEEEEDGRFDS